jgi:hypothetical protein
MNQISLGKVVFVVALTAGVSLAIACGSSSHPALGTQGNNAFDPYACATPGAVQSCHVNLGTNNGVVTCAVGTQVCDGSHWGACSTGGGGVKTATYGGSFTSAGYKPSGSTLSQGTGGGLHILADPVDASSDAGLCRWDDPCDPYCFGWDDEASAPAAAPPPPVSGGSPAGLPSGWYNAASKASCGAPLNPSDCNYDQCCAANGGPCVDWTTNPATANCSTASVPGLIAAGCAAQPDFTAQVGCNDPVSNDVIVPVCNRGGVAANAGLLYIALRDDAYTPGPTHFPFVTGKGDCTVDLGPTGINGGAGLAPGACFPVDLSNPQAGVKCYGLKIEKRNSIFINGGGGNGSASNAANISLPECTGANNWTAINNQKCAAAVVGGGGAILTCVDATTVGSMSSKNISPCHPGNGLGQCLFDECCYKNGSNDCRQWGAANTGDCNLGANGCGGQQNYTATAGCKDTNGDMHLQICNRGDTDVNAGIFNVGFGLGGVRNYAFLSLDGCSWDWANVGGLGSNGCVDLNVSQSTINGSGAGVSCGLMPATIGTIPYVVRVNTTGTIGIVSTGNNNNGLAECGGGDNWAMTDPGVACTGCPATPTGDGGGSYTYTAKCAPGYRVNWQYLVYDVNSGEVEFNATTTTTLVDGSVLPPSTSYQLADPPNNPVSSACHYQAPAVGGCPVNLATILGKDAHGETMNLDIVPHNGANVVGWSISYDCVPYE